MNSIVVVSDTVRFWGNQSILRRHRYGREKAKAVSCGEIENRANIELVSESWQFVVRHL